MRPEPANLRRFDGAKVDPAHAVALSANHPAAVEGRTVFPTTVASPEDSPRFLVSGVNNPKLGRAVTKGPRAGWSIFHLTLEERATCPRSCHAWLACYGNAMPFARRHSVDGDFLEMLEAEIATTARQHPQGLLIRLHTLGDFFSIEYVALWERVLRRWPQVHVFGYTARSAHDKDPLSRAIGSRLDRVAQNWERFAVRVSSSEAGEERSIIVDEDPGLPDVIVCPAQTHKTTACATCGLCWADAARSKTIAFLRHGMSRHHGARGQSAHRGGQRIESKASRSLADVREALPALFAANPDGLTTADIMAATGLPYLSATRALVALDKAGEVRWGYIGRGTGKMLLPIDHQPPPDRLPMPPVVDHPMISSRLRARAPNKREAAPSVAATVSILPATPLYAPWRPRRTVAHLPDDIRVADPPARHGPCVTVRILGEPCETTPRPAMMTREEIARHNAPILARALRNG